MTISPSMQTYLKYAAAALISFLTGALTYVIPLLMDPTEPNISWRLVLGTGLSAVMATGISSRLIRPGSESIARQVHSLGQHGVERGDMVVVPSPASGVSPSDVAGSNPRIYEVMAPRDTTEVGQSERQVVS